MKTVTSFLWYFALFFVIFALVGAFQIRKQMTSPEYAQNFVVSHLALSHTPSGTFLVLEKDRRPYWELNTDNNAARWSSPDGPLEALSDARTLWEPASEASLTAFLGGVGGWTLKDVWKTLADKEAKRGAGAILGAVLGTVIGYRIGGWLGYRWSASPLNPNVQVLLKDKTKYPELKRLAFLRLYGFTSRLLVRRSISGALPADVRRRLADLTIALMSAQSLDKDLRADDFQLLLWARPETQPLADHS